MEHELDSSLEIDKVKNMTITYGDYDLEAETDVTAKVEYIINQKLES